MDSIIKDFKILFEGEKVFLTKLGDAYIVSIRRFDPATGDEVSPHVEAIDVESLNKIKISANNIVENVDFILSEIVKLD